MYVFLIKVKLSKHNPTPVPAWKRGSKEDKNSKDQDTNLATDLPHAKLEKTRRAKVALQQSPALGTIHILQDQFRDLSSS